MAGQHQLARELLAQFPTEGVAGETLGKFANCWLRQARSSSAAERCSTN
jgi:hypothetical protein